MKQLDQVVVDTSTTTIKLLTQALDREMIRNKALTHLVIKLDIALGDLLNTPNKATRQTARELINREPIDKEIWEAFDRLDKEVLDER